MEGLVELLRLEKQGTVSAKVEVLVRLCPGVAKCGWRKMSKV